MPGVTPGLGPVLEDNVQTLVETPRKLGLAGALPAAARSAAIPGLRGKTQYLHARTGHLQRPSQHVEQ